MCVVVMCFLYWNYATGACTRVGKGHTVRFSFGEEESPTCENDASESLASKS